MDAPKFVALAYTSPRIKRANIALTEILAAPKAHVNPAIAAPNTDIVVEASGRAVKLITYMVAGMADTRFAVVAGTIVGIWWARTVAKGIIVAYPTTAVDNL